MKRGWIGLALLVVLLASSLFTAKKMEEYHNDGTQMLTQAGTCALEENWAAARQLAFQAMKQWQKHREFTAAFADHEPMEDVVSPANEPEFLQRMARKWALLNDLELILS